MQPIAVIFTLPEEDLEAVNEALAAGSVAVTSVSRDGNVVLDSGTLTLIDNEIQQATGTLKLKATFNNSRSTLWPGQYVNARVLVHTDRDALTLPSSAVQLGPNGPFTYVVKGDSTVEVRPLKLGAQTEAVTVVTAGLAPNERVVTSNQYRLQAGTRVTVNTVPSAAGVAKTAAPRKAS
jgi:multidrug efflux system membrane fusion protein